MQIKFRARIAVVTLLIGCITVTYFLFGSGGVAGSSGGSSASSSEPHFQEKLALIPTATHQQQQLAPAASASTAPAQAAIGKDLLDVNLEQLFQQALEAKNPENRALAFWVGSYCSAFTASKGVSEKDLMTSFGLKPEQAKSVMERHATALNEMQKFCSTGNSVAFLDSLFKLNKPGIPLVGAVMGRTDLPDTADSLRRQEHSQALTQMLASPSQYPAQFDRWLDSRSFSNASKTMGADSNLVPFVADELMIRFGVEQMRSFRQLRQCVSFFRCARTNDLPAVQRTAVETSAGQMETLIRTQRWDIFLPQGG